MARVTVEDCVTKFQNRFELVLMSAARARQIAAGERPTVPEDRDKNPVIALREIADSTVTPDQLRENVVRGMQRYVEVDEPESDEATQEMISQHRAAEGEEVVMAGSAEANEAEEAEAEADEI